MHWSVFLTRSDNRYSIISELKNIAAMLERQWEATNSEVYFVAMVAIEDKITEMLELDAVEWDMVSK